MNDMNNYFAVKFLTEQIVATIALLLIAGGAGALSFAEIKDSRKKITKENAFLSVILIGAIIGIFYILKYWMERVL